MLNKILNHLEIGSKAGGDQEIGDCCVRPQKMVCSKYSKTKNTHYVYSTVAGLEYQGRTVRQK